MYLFLEIHFSSFMEKYRFESKINQLVLERNNSWAEPIDIFLLCALKVAKIQNIFSFWSFPQKKGSQFICRATLQALYVPFFKWMMKIKKTKLFEF